MNESNSLQSILSSIFMEIWEKKVFVFIVELIPAEQILNSSFDKAI